MGLGFSFDPRTHPFYLTRMVLARDLVRRGAGSFSVGEDGAPEFRCDLAHGETFRFSPRTADDLEVLDEVFGRRIYDLYPSFEPFVLDIGMNVGLASIFYAGVKGWEVLAFEPFPATFALAEANLARCGLTARVQARRAGVAGRSGRVEVAAHEGAHSTNGLFGNLNPNRTGSDAAVAIELVDAAKAFDETLALAGGRPVVAKIDCEGAEYEILDRLAATGRLERIAALTVEAHRIRPEHDPGRLIALLAGRGFVVQRLWGSYEAEGILAYRGA